MQVRMSGIIYDWLSNKGYIKKAEQAVGKELARAYQKIPFTELAAQNSISHKELRRLIRKGGGRVRGRGERISG